MNTLAFLLVLAQAAVLAQPAPNGTFPPACTHPLPPTDKPRHRPQPPYCTPAGGDSELGELNAQFRAKGKQYFGAEMDYYHLADDALTTILKKSFGQVTCENSMKWDATESSQGSFSFDNADKVVDFAMANHKYMRGHTLLWHGQLPDWVSNITDANTLARVLENHVTTLVTRYKGKILQWDVANEIFAENGSLRDSVFSRLLGEDFVSIAFKAARAADLDAKLFINDFNLDNANYSKLTDGMVAHVNKWVAAGVPIDGIGSQCHLGPNMTSSVPDALKALAAANVSQIAITELDIGGASADDYMTVVNGCLAVPKCVGVTTWGVGDKSSWRSSDEPLLFDGDYKAKPAYSALLSALL